MSQVAGRARVENAGDLVRNGNAPGVRYCVWEITLACDLGCKTCGSRAGKARPDELSTEECLDVVRQLKEMGMLEVTLIGGEAYLRDDWDIIAKAITDAGIACGITTGGRGLTQERVDRAVAAGVSGISLSIDGLERTHNSQRGTSDSFRNAVAAARRVKASGMHLGINSQINRLSMPELPALADLLIELGAQAWQLQLTVPMGRAADRPDLLLQPYDLLELFPLIAWLKSEKLSPANIDVFPGNNIGYFGEYEEAIRFGGAEGTHWGGCGAGKDCMGVEADGTIKACPSLPTEDYTGGNSRTSAVADVMENAEEITFIAKRTREDLWGFCGDCYYADVCKGGCTWTAQVLMGRPGNNPYCIHRALTLEGNGQHEVLRRVKAAPGDPFDHGRFETVLVEGPPPSEEATILGKPVAEVMALKWQSGGAWEPDVAKKRLQILS